MHWCGTAGARAVCPLGSLCCFFNGLPLHLQEDPSFNFARDDETNQTVIQGMGECGHTIYALCGSGNICSE